MMTILLERLQAAPVIPLIEAGDAKTALAQARALQAGGLEVVEVVQRTDRSLECLEAIVAEMPDLVVGAGTVLSATEAEACLGAGAQFVVSPGLDTGVVEAAVSRGFDAIPGIMTPTELLHARSLGLEVLKFFPAAPAGGVAALRAFAGVFPDIRFIPTGGISSNNLADYLALDCVLACGGSWLTPGDAVDSGDFEQITGLAAEALAVAATIRGVAPR